MSVREDILGKWLKFLRKGEELKKKWLQFIRDPDYKLDEEMTRFVLNILVRKLQPVVEDAMRAHVLYKYGYRKESKNVLGRVKARLNEAIEYVDLILSKWGG